jgi:hypothetical protein
MQKDRDVVAMLLIRDVRYACGARLATTLPTPLRGRNRGAKAFEISTATIQAGPHAVVNDPDSPRRILLENDSNHRKSARRRRIPTASGARLRTAAAPPTRLQRFSMSPEGGPAGATAPGT